MRIEKKKKVILDGNNISQQYYLTLFIYLFLQINAALLRIRHVFHNH